MKALKDFGFKKEINDVIDQLKFDEATSIQEAAIPLIMKYQDVIGISKTGSGKTHAFLLPVMQRIDISQEKVQATITAPTRELASQIYENCKVFMQSMPGLRVSLMVGGSDRQKAMDKLSTQPHIVIGTPGRIKDLSLDEQALKITTSSIFVVDEADMTLEFGYLEDIDAVAGKMKEDLQMLVFSATIPQNLRPFLRKYMKNPQLVEIKEDRFNEKNVEHILVPTKHRDRYSVLKNLMEGIDPYICLIFCNTREEASQLSYRLREDGYRVGEIHGDLQPRERRQMMRRIKNMDYQYIVATDIAARGIDIDGVSHVISMDLPKELDFYIHRSGRCGRGKYTGVAYTLYDSKNEDKVKLLEKKGITFKQMDYKQGQWVELKERERRKTRIKEPTELEKQVQKIIKKPVKVKPGYKKKRKREIETLVRKQKRAIIQKDIARQKKERAKMNQRAQRESEE